MILSFWQRGTKDLGSQLRWQPRKSWQTKLPAPRQRFRSSPICPRAYRGNPLMPSEITLKVNGASLSVPEGATVAAAVAIAGQVYRRSVVGEPRGPLCGMGVCYECRVVINGRSHCRSCQILCRPGMDVRTDE